MAIKKPNDDELIEDLLQPISDIYQETNTKVLSIITERIKSIGKMTPTDAARLSILLKNQDLKQIETILSEATNLSIKQIDSIVTESAAYNDELATKLYEHRNMPLSTIATDSALLNVVEVAKKNMVDSVVNLSKTTGFMINGKMTDVAKTYNFAINRSIFEVQQGLFDFNTSMRSTIKELADSGIRTIDFESGYSRRLDSQVRLNIREGISVLNENYRKTQANQYGADKVFVSLHGMCAQDHQQINGMDYTAKEWDRVSSSLDRQVGQNNCRHSLSYGIDGISDNPYSDKDRSDAIRNSNKRVEYTTLKKDSNGNYVKKSLSKVDMSNKLRQTETEIRRLKDVKNQFEVMDDKGMIQEYNKKISAKTKYYKQIASETGLETKMERVRVVKSDKINITKNTVVNQSRKQTILTSSKIDLLSEKQLKEQLRKNAVAYYNTPAMKKLIGNRKPEDVVDNLLKGANKTSMRKDLISIIKKLNK